MTSKNSLCLCLCGQSKGPLSRLLRNTRQPTQTMARALTRVRAQIADEPHLILGGVLFFAD